jgi:hypothetical protein
MTSEQALVSGKVLHDNSAEAKKSARCGRPSQRLTDAQLHQAVAILTFDLYKQGRIRKWQCPQHGRVALTYRYQKSDGVHVWCEVPGCKRTTHFDEVNFQSGKSNCRGKLEETEEYEIDE